MRCLAVCQGELLIRILDEILLPGFEVEFVVESLSLARRLHDAGINATFGCARPAQSRRSRGPLTGGGHNGPFGHPRRADTFIKADVGPSPCVIIEDKARR